MMKSHQSVQKNIVPSNTYETKTVSFWLMNGGVKWSSKFEADYSTFSATDSTIPKSH